ncbi:hypothetical protein RHGRI_037382 [Rhododendron griersonianum]|uniref:non-specific serine/threonine protein kinase n=1 Tax=Rhododendron griersonianum TaxID=479676 RepID=A0AAV6HRJ3_9ERIC|nr:hypothetical protein RHGRI_037382 [Rhododendron griersonianum]
MPVKYANVNYVENQDEVTLSYSIPDPSISVRLVINDFGMFQWFTWKDNEHRWVEIYAGPKKPCDSYNYCGPNGYCDSSNIGMGQFECMCLPGFEPKTARDWYLRDGSSGCVRKRDGHVCGRGEGFEKVPLAKVPNTWTARVDRGVTWQKECESECLRNCSCNAYASADVSRGDSGCVTWHGDLMDSRVLSSEGQDLYIRVDAVELDGDLLISSNQTFALGFFTPGKLRNPYLGIWYNTVSEQTIVWVANGDSPINNTSGSLSFDVTGNLVVTGLDRNNLVWSTNVSDPTLAKNSSAQLLDSGNLVVLDSNGVDVWQSFDYPTNTLLPNLRFGVNRNTGLDWFLTSWKSGDDPRPRPGEYSFKI